jgi:IS4 transposase
MAFDTVLQRFIEKSPVSVMARLAVQRAVGREWVDSLFEQHRERQYTRELLFSMVVEMMSLVAMGLRPSLHAAAKESNLPVSMAAVYDKVNRVEAPVVRAMVQQSAQRLSPVVAAMKGEDAGWAPGYRVRIVDGNHLPATDKRVKPLRGFRGAALPGHALVVYSPEEGLVVDMVPIEDAHAQERTGMPAILERAQGGDLWMGDRNFCTTGIIVSLWDKEAAFILREHGRSPNPTVLGQRRKVGRIETGLVYEEDVQVEDETGRLLKLRRVELQLDEPTEDGDSVIRLLTNTPKHKLSATKVARLYRKRWSIEGMFQRLESALNSELRTLGQPKAALLAFATAVVSYNVLSVLQSAVEAAHPQAKDEGIELSSYFVALQARAAYEGMLIAVPEQLWGHYEDASPDALAKALIRIAAHAKPARLRKHPRGPKRKTKTGYVSREVASRHVSTARVLADGHVSE